jgi:type IV pilus assembly protein PilB
VIATIVNIGDVANAVVRRIPESMAWEFGALPIKVEDSALTVAFASEPHEGALRRIERATGLHVEPAVAPADQIQTELSRVFGRAATAIVQTWEAPAVRATARLHDRAFLERCSDIHIEPRPHSARVRFRIDGILRDAETIDDPLATSVVSRIKLLAGLDITDNHRPQDGRYTINSGGHVVDMRVSTVPVRDGENIVIRLFDRRMRSPSLRDLGMSDTIREAFSEVIARSSGFVVACGPNGSGKTNTLYAALSKLNTPERNICTVEDPVEQTVEGATQVQVNPKAGVTFASALRSLLRQDPNIIMVSEMREEEPASIAVSAAISGHMVFSTLHGNDAPRCIERIAELNVTRSSLAAGLSAVLSQRLVRRLCPHCKHGMHIDASTAHRFGLDRARMYFEARGCERCEGTGYHGRIGIFELIVINDALRDMISSGVTSTVFAQLAREYGYRCLAEDCIEKLHAGITSIEEFRRMIWQGENDFANYGNGKSPNGTSLLHILSNASKARRPS